MDTEAKILAFLSVRPQTSEELWKYSRIHKNTMVKRLTKLVERNCVIKHRYALPYNDYNYGMLRIVGLDYQPTAKNGRIYYLLNCSSNSTKSLLSYYFTNSNENLEDELKEKELTPLIESNPFSRPLSDFKLWFDSLSSQESMKVIIDGLRGIVDIHKKRIEIDYKLVQNRTNFTREYKYGPKGLRSVINYFSKISGSIYDIIIRIMTDPVETEGKVLKEMLGYRYVALWNTLKKENRLPQDLKHTNQT